MAWATFALASPFGWLALICPALMLYFLCRITGIPATEAQSLRSRGEAHRRYQQTTSVRAMVHEDLADRNGFTTSGVEIAL